MVGWLLEWWMVYLITIYQSQYFTGFHWVNSAEHSGTIKAINIPLSTFRTSEQQEPGTVQLLCGACSTCGWRAEVSGWWMTECPSHNYFGINNN